MNFAVFVYFLWSIITLNIFSIVTSQSDNLADYFSHCKKNESDFDNCVKDGLNGVRHLFKTGVPKYNIAPFDPFFASEVPQKVGGRFFNYKLILKNVFESGWTISQVTRFRSDFNKNMIQYTQFFPDKKLKGEYDFVATIFGNTYANKGPWNLSLYDFVQTTTITRKPRIASNATLVYDTPLKASVEVQSCKNMELHIGHLLQGRTVIVLHSYTIGGLGLHTDLYGASLIVIRKSCGSYY
ncbi:uncharacterized protein LOC108734162 isoform X2 [Agrilus planipennis]|uniref:Uncharacterized protein LOC108734162 isoform X2 n=1 Tax=Agrilus planipennis TaxID=224129 RepID=A0A1W4WAR0_AGRPL|nr:uncharacterized protein LOC108734162 isoform X2 [Agrilus planipennis]